MTRNVDKAANRLEAEIRTLEREQDQAAGLMARCEEGSYDWCQAEAQYRALSRRLRTANQDLDDLLGDW